MVISCEYKGGFGFKTVAFFLHMHCILLSANFTFLFTTNSTQIGLLYVDLLGTSVLRYSGLIVCPQLAQTIGEVCTWRSGVIENVIVS